MEQCDRSLAFGRNPAQSHIIFRVNANGKRLAMQISASPSESDSTAIGWVAINQCCRWQYWHWTVCLHGIVAIPSITSEPVASTQTGVSGQTYYCGRRWWLDPPSVCWRIIALVLPRSGLPRCGVRPRDSEHRRTLVARL